MQGKRVKKLIHGKQELYNRITGQTVVVTFTRDGLKEPAYTVATEHTKRKFEDYMEARNCYLRFVGSFYADGWRDKQLVEACEFALETLGDLTTEDYSKGKDKPARDKLEEALRG